jgi:Zn-dependent protease
MKKINFITILKGVADRFLPALFWILIVFGFDTPCVAAITLISAAIHELGHICAAMLVGIFKSLPEGRLNGLKIKIKGCGYKSLIFVLSAGPLANLLTAALLFPFLKISEYLNIVVLVNIATAVSNLIPVKGYDGYGIAEAVLLMTERQTVFLESLSFFTSIILTFFSLFMIGRFGVGYWVFFAFFIGILKRIRFFTLQSAGKL